MPDGLYYQPAPSPMDPEITPKAFLPSSDPRKSSSLYYPEEETLIKSNIKYMPVIFEKKLAKKYGLTKENVLELQKMRDHGATRKQMKEKFHVSDFFISIATQRNPKIAHKEEKTLKKVVKRWSRDTKEARILKEKQKLMWQRGL